MGNPILFLILAAIAVAAALGMVLSRNAVHSALFLVLNFVTVAILYLVLNAPFIAMVQITVYAGAIVVLFLFVIMLLGAERLTGVRGGSLWQRVLALVLGVALLAVFGVMLLQGDVAGSFAAQPLEGGPVALGLRLFEAYMLPFQVTGVLLLAAIIGVVVFGRGGKEGKNA